MNNEEQKLETNSLTLLFQRSHSTERQRSTIPT